MEKSSALTPTDWEISKFRMRSKRVVAFKAEQPMPNENDTYYCRFMLSEETFDSDDDAPQRLAQLHNAFPDGPVEDQYTLVLRDGFRVGRTAYILQTDASKFLNEIRRLTKTLTESTAGAEQAHLPGARDQRFLELDRFTSNLSGLVCAVDDPPR